MQIIEVTDLAVRSAVIRLRRPKAPLVFVLYPMVHVAQAAFYAEVTRRLRAANVVVREGIKPGRRPSILSGALTMTYRITRFNPRLKLVTQKIPYATLRAEIVEPDVTDDEFRAGWRGIRLGWRILLYAAVPVVMLARLLGGTRSMWDKTTEVGDLVSAEDSSDMTDAFDAVTLGERDRRLLAALAGLHDEHADEAIEIAVVYGADHIPAVVHGLSERYGYKARSADWLTVVDL